MFHSIFILFPDLGGISSGPGMVPSSNEENSDGCFMDVEKDHHLNESWRLFICFMAVLRVIFWHELGVHPGPLPHTELSKLTQHGEMFQKWMVWDRIADATIQSGYRTNSDGFDDLSFSFVASFCKPHRFQVDALYKLHNSQLEKQRGLVIKKQKSQVSSVHMTARLDTKVRSSRIVTGGILHSEWAMRLGTDPWLTLSDA